MRIIAIAERGFYDYISETLNQHPQHMELVGFAEWAPKEMEYNRTPVISLANLCKDDYDTLLVAIHFNHHLSRLLTYMHDQGLNNVKVIRLFALETYADFVNGDQFNPIFVDEVLKANEKPYLVHLETHVCDQCNLNCKGCNNFSPFTRDRRLANIEQFEANMQSLANMFSNIGRFFLLGGEPLLEPEHCCEMIKISRRFFPNTELRLLTNAILVPKMKSEFWDCVRENHVIIHVSAYPPVLPKLPEIESIFCDNGIVFLIAKEVSKFERHWTQYPFEDKNYNNEKCRSAGCHYLRNGVIAKCPDSILIGAMAPAMGCAPEELRSIKDEIELDSCGDAWELIRELNAPCRLCQKCTMQRRKLVVWEPCGAVADPNDWFLENRLTYENRQLKKQLRNNTQTRQENSAYNAVINSFSYKLGQTLTWLPRKVRGGIRCLKEHGVKYTVNLFFKKFTK